VLESLSTGLSFLSSAAGVAVSVLGLYEVIYSLGPAPSAVLKFDGSTDSFQLTVLRGSLRRRTNAQSIVRFAPGTGMYFPGGRRFYRNQIGFEVDVVFLDAQQVVVGISRAGDNSSMSPYERHAASFFICNKGDAAGISTGQKALLEIASPAGL